MFHSVEQFECETRFSTDDQFRRDADLAQKAARVDASGEIMDAMFGSIPHPYTSACSNIAALTKVLAGESPTPARPAPRENYFKKSDIQDVIEAIPLADIAGFDDLLRKRMGASSDPHPGMVRTKEMGWVTAREFVDAVFARMKR